jgi:hypothetical protein
MTVFANSIFNIPVNTINISGNAFNVTSGANIINKMSLCNVNIDFKEYQRLSVVIPENATNFVLTFPVFTNGTTFISIVPDYPSKAIADELNYLEWKFVTSNDPMQVMSEFLALTTNSLNPFSDILINNPSDCKVRIEVLVSGIPHTGNGTPNVVLFSGLNNNNLQTS